MAVSGELRYDMDTQFMRIIGQMLRANILKDINSATFLDFEYFVANFSYAISGGLTLSGYRW